MISAAGRNTYSRYWGLQTGPEAQSRLVVTRAPEVRYTVLGAVGPASTVGSDLDVTSVTVYLVAMVGFTVNE